MISLFTEEKSLIVQEHNFKKTTDMDKQKIHYSFILSEEQMEYLRSKKYKIDRMDCFMSLAPLAVRETKLEPISKTQQVEILPGQFMIDNTKLAKLWDKDRKTVPKILEAMEKLGISSSQKIGDNRIHTLHALSGWYVDGVFRKNAFASRRNDASQRIFHVEVPPARVITIEEACGKNTYKESMAVANGNSHSSSEGINSSSDSKETPPSSLSNDINNVGKSADGDKSSVSSSSDKSYQPYGSRNSADTASSLQEADGKQNEGKTDGQNSSQQYCSVGSGYHNPNGFQKG